MSLNARCPKCGSTKCVVTDFNKSHGCLWLIIFGFLYILWIAIKWLISIMLIICLDWWLAIIMKCFNKDYKWLGKGLIVRRKFYYCNECGNNFKA